MKWNPSISAHTWPEAQALAGSVDGWHMPTLKEQESIVDYRFINPVVDPTVVPNMVPAQYWTATPANNGFQWCVDFMTGSAVQVQSSDPNAKCYVMLVQGNLEQSVVVGTGATVTDPAIVRAGYARLGIIADPAGVEWWSRNPLGMMEFWRGTRDEFVRICNEELAKP